MRYEYVANPIARVQKSGWIPGPKRAPPSVAGWAAVGVGGWAVVVMCLEAGY